MSGNIFKTIFKSKAGGSLEVRNDGVSVSSEVTIINVQSSTHDAVFVSANEVMITDYIFASHWNLNDGLASCVVGDRATTSRYISDPAPENNYDIDSWSPGDSRQSYNGASWVYDSINPCSFEDNSTTYIEVNIYDADGVTVIATHTTAFIAGNIDVTVNNIRIQVTGFAADGTKYQGRIIITIAMNLILAVGGRITLEMIHVNGGTNYTKLEANKFYDPNTTAQAISGATIAENTISSSKYLSGLQYYDEGDSFDIAIADLDFLNVESYIDNFVRINAQEYGITNFNLSGADLTGWTNYWNNQNASYSDTKVIDIDDYRYIGTACNIIAQVWDWVAGASANSPNASVLIDTYDQESDELSEYFTDEVFRRLSGFTGAEGLWDSTQDITAYDGGSGAQIIGGILKVPDTDFTAYLPAGNPDYSGQIAPKDYYRRIIDISGLVRGSATLSISGFTLANLIASDVEMWIHIPGKFTTPCFAHGAALYNFATFDGDNDPIRLGSSSANSIDITFGGLGLDAGNTYFILCIVINNAAINPSSIVCNW